MILSRICEHIRSVFLLVHKCYIKICCCESVLEVCCPGIRLGVARVRVIAINVNPCNQNSSRSAKISVSNRSLHAFWSRIGSIGYTFILLIVERRGIRWRETRFEPAESWSNDFRSLKDGPPATTTPRGANTPKDQRWYNHILEELQCYILANAHLSRATKPQKGPDDRSICC